MSADHPARRRPGLLVVDEPAVLADAATRWPLLLADDPMRATIGPSYRAVGHGGRNGAHGPHG